MLTFCDKHGHKAVEEAVKDNAGIKLWQRKKTATTNGQIDKYRKGNSLVYHTLNKGF